MRVALSSLLKSRGPEKSQGAKLSGNAVSTWSSVSGPDMAIERPAPLAMPGGKMRQPGSMMDRCFPAKNDILIQRC